MKVYKAFAFLSIFIILFYNCSLPANDEEKGDSEEEDTVTSELPWEGEMDKFTINSKEGIHLNLEFTSPLILPLTIMHDFI